MNVLGFLSSPASPPRHSTQWVPFVLAKSPPISPSKSRQIQVEFNTQTLTQRLGLIAGFVWAQMCSSLGGGHFSCHLSQTAWLHTKEQGGETGGTAMWTPVVGITPDFPELVYCGGSAPIMEEMLPTKVLSRWEAPGAPLLPLPTSHTQEPKWHSVSALNPRPAKPKL